MPHAIAYNADAAPDALAAVAGANGAKTAAGGMWDLAKSSGAPMRLTDIGFDPADIPRAVDLVMAAPYPNPRPMEPGAIAATLQAACDGDRPS
jgi:alcohol dehydrogenase class IV